MSGRHARHLGLSAYVDVFKYPWQTALILFPVTGHDILVELESDHWPSVNFSVRYRNRSAVISSSGIDNFGRTVRLLSDRLQQTLRFRMRHELSGRLQLYGSVERTLVAEGDGSKQETGYVLCQGLRYSTHRILGELRLMFFDTRSFSSRLYQYENDLTGVFHNHLLFGRGDRWYALVRYHLSKNLVLSLKYAETLIDGAKTVGSGPMEIAGDIDNRLSMQVDLTL
jgi:predicted porin